MILKEKMCEVPFTAPPPTVPGWEVGQAEMGMGICSKRDKCRHLVEQIEAKPRLDRSWPGIFLAKGGRGMSPTRLW